MKYILPTLLMLVVPAVAQTPGQQATKRLELQTALETCNNYRLPPLNVTPPKYMEGWEDCLKIWEKWDADTKTRDDERKEAIKKALK